MDKGVNCLNKNPLLAHPMPFTLDFHQFPILVLHEKEIDGGEEDANEDDCDGGGAYDEENELQMDENREEKGEEVVGDDLRSPWVHIE
mmetsp:Transcript_10791/g.40345  ORF Transcript_10791/g.40345 Transcript_10791/m.40345 type:complete len:88 (+) Transcript_10791:438-701(+)|eukprot:CAMPEP_0117434994 /NCGR_PEP_ID=MMETSP0759-20121206/243_1 /TAXON_ID=63605 /ORGANISM="Percolomonas cosmopolitus, Strain WS" /LENGTH=87 /DNA_ID=CAMNT_0005226509 /DNA_START=333 /DNA_END=596 /DNA_ORIENTATION=-